MSGKPRSRFTGGRAAAPAVRLAALPALLSLMALLTAAGCGPRSPQPGEPLEAFTAALDERVPGLLERLGVPGASLALVVDGQPVWAGAYGYADVASGRRMSVEAVCRAESISKSVTAWGVMRLVDRGLLELDAPVQRYLGGWQLPASGYSAEAITVRRLLSGDAGLPLGTIGPDAEYPPGADMPSLRDYLREEARLNRQPGSGFEYSNVGFDLLELVVEEAAGMDFSLYMQEQVLAPLGMRGASFSWEEGFGASLPTGYELDGTPVPPYVYPVRAAGGLLADVQDIARFAAAGATGRAPDPAAAVVPGGGPIPVLRPESIRAMHTPQVKIAGIFGAVAESYGLGHFIETLPDGRRAVWHGGQGHGWMTHFHLVPESGEGIVILTNSARSWPFIAAVLRDWAKWRGFGSVGFAKITWAAAAARAFVAVVVLLCLGLVWRVVRGLVRGRRRFAPLSRRHRCLRLLQAAAGSGAVAALAWAAAQPYLFVTSILPSTAGWAGLALLALALLVIAAALFPRTDPRPEG